MATAAAPPPPTLDPALFPGLIQHHPEHCLLYCRPCTAVVFRGALWRHLQTSHRLPVAQRKLLVRHCQALDLITQPEDLRLPPDESPPLPFLPVRRG